MALKTDKLIHGRIDKLHQKVCLDSTKPLTLEDCMEFVKTPSSHSGNNLRAGC